MTMADLPEAAEILLQVAKKYAQYDGHLATDAHVKAAAFRFVAAKLASVSAHSDVDWDDVRNLLKDLERFARLAAAEAVVVTPSTQQKGAKLVKIVQEGTLTKRTTCDRCQSELEYEPEDVQMTSYADNGGVDYWIKCPICLSKLGPNRSFVYVPSPSKPPTTGTK
jgi:hypothetical protein